MVRSPMLAQERPSTKSVPPSPADSPPGDGRMDLERLFDTNYWGVVYGSLVAVEHFKTRDGGGTVVKVATSNPPIDNMPVIRRDL